MKKHIPVCLNSAMKHLKPFFQNGEIKRKGVFVIGTVMGDLHDIGKNLTGMMVEGSGWEVIDLGTDADAVFEKIKKSFESAEQATMSKRESAKSIRRRISMSFLCLPFYFFRFRNP